MLLMLMLLMMFMQGADKLLLESSAAGQRSEESSAHGGSLLEPGGLPDHTTAATSAFEPIGGGRFRRRDPGGQHCEYRATGSSKGAQSAGVYDCTRMKLV